MAYYFDTFIYYNMVADVLIFIFCNYSTYYFLYSLYCTLDPSGLFTTHYQYVPLNTVALIYHTIPLLTTFYSLVFTGLIFFFFFRFHL